MPRGVGVRVPLSARATAFGSRFFCADKGTRSACCASADLSMVGCCLLCKYSTKLGSSFLVLVQMQALFAVCSCEDSYSKLGHRPIICQIYATFALESKSARHREVF